MPALSNTDWHRMVGKGVQAGFSRLQLPMSYRTTGYYFSASRALGAASDNNLDCNSRFRHATAAPSAWEPGIQEGRYAPTYTRCCQGGAFQSFRQLAVSKPAGGITETVFGYRGGVEAPDRTPQGVKVQVMHGRGRHLYVNFESRQPHTGFGRSLDPPGRHPQPSGPHFRFAFAATSALDCPPDGAR